MHLKTIQLVIFTSNNSVVYITIGLVYEHVREFEGRQSHKITVTMKYLIISLWAVVIGL